MSKPALKTRFAPSPTGLLHLGNVRTALFNHLVAQSGGGTFLLRMEDTDAVRGEEKYEIALQEDLHWLGLTWQEGPGVGGDNGPYMQSERGKIYDQHFETLRSAGNIYPCFCTEHELKLSRKAQAAADKAPRYNGKCRNLTEDEVQANFSAGKAATLRFRVPRNQVIEFEDGVRGPQRFVSDDIGDFIIRRSNGAPAFFFSNAVDDALMKVSLVVRGEDHLTNTPRQLMLLEALGLPAPDYAHIALVVGEDGAPLSKRNGSQSVMELRDQGYLPQAIVNYLARLGHSYESNDFMSYDELAKAFRTEKLHRAPARFDAVQLMHWQREAIASASDEALWQWVNEFEIAGDRVEIFVPEKQHEMFIRTVRENIEMPQDAFFWAANLFTDSGVYDHKARTSLLEADREFFNVALKLLDDGENDFKSFLKQLTGNTGKKGKLLYMPLRAALTGETDQRPGMENHWHDGPQMGSIWKLLDKNTIQRRLQLARDLTKE
ncbi:MAG: glutamate--tRNA ligase [Acidiferrobacterales bacterium]